MHCTSYYVCLLGLSLGVITGVLSQRMYFGARRPSIGIRPSVSRQGQAGMCRFGSRSSCCYGWKANHFGGCSPVCRHECMHGTCVGPNVCRCNKGFTGNTCDKDLNECSARPCSHRCMNTRGSYRCYCEHGYLLLNDGKSCTRDDRCSDTRCSFGCIQHHDGFTCFCPEGLKLLPDGLGCTDINECESGAAKCAANRRCQNTYGNYMCLCPMGYKFAYQDGDLDCVDENECDSNRCDSNAYCVNVIGGFQCKCNDGYLGNGYKCAAIGTTTCLDEPCFHGVPCTSVALPAVDDIPVTNATVLIKQFECGKCPPSFDGDGLICNPTSIAVQIIAVDIVEANTPLADVTIRALLSQDGGPTDLITEGITDMNGVAILRVPPDVSVGFVASKEEYVTQIKTYYVQPDSGNAVVIPMESYTELTSFVYRELTSKAFEFGNNDESTPDFRVSFPEGALRAEDGTLINIHYKGVDVSSMDALALVPDLTRVASLNMGSNKQHLIPLGAAEVSILDSEGTIIQLTKPSYISFELKNYLDILGVGESIDAYYFDIISGKWIKDGTGILSVSDDGRDIWTYEPSHFTWWVVAVAFTPDRCLTVRTCYDAQCNRPVAHIPIIISGEGFFYYEEHETGTSGTVCVNIFSEKINRFRVLQNCTGQSELVRADISKTSRCAQHTVDNGCSVVTFIIPEMVTSTCRNPGKPENSVRIGDDFSLGSAVNFFCDPDFKIKGNSQRICTRCGSWSGFQPFCTQSSFSSEGSGSSFLDI